MNEDKSARYHRLQRRAGLVATGVNALVLLFLLATGWSAALRNIASAAARGSFALTVSAYVCVVVLITEVVQLPFAFYRGVVLERRYGLSTQTTPRWCLDQLKGAALTTPSALCVVTSAIGRGTIRLAISL